MSTPKTPVAQPFVKWAGGKRQIIHELISLVPGTFGRYFEPFVGGGALFFELSALGRLSRPAILGDSNALLINAYSQLKISPDPVIRELGKLKYDEKVFYDVREGFPMGSPVMRAAQLIYLNRACFNGLWRVNRKGKFNVPFGRYTNPTICDADNLRLVGKALRTVGLMAADFEKVAAQAVAGDFVYFDPPYWPKGGYADFTSYAKEPFGPPEQERLRDVARTLKARGVHVLLSNADMPEVRKLYARGFKLKSIQAKRAINSKTSARGNTGELLIT
jgi:DNA adenine methylase